MRKNNINSNTNFCPLIKNHLIPRKDKGFTLIELLIVIGIIGILSGMIMVNFSGTTDKARLAKAREFSQSILSAMGADLAGAWTFDEGTGTTAKDSWGVNHGTLKNFDFSASSGWKSASDCISGSCLQFDGVNDYVNCGNNPSLNITNAITIEAWVKSANYSGSKDILTKYYYDWAFRQTWNGNGVFIFILRIEGTLRDLTYNNPSYLWNGDWHHIVGTFDGITRKIFVDGGQKASNSNYSGKITTSGRELKLGFSDSSHEYFNGLIDEVRIYNTALPAAQIQQHYVQGLEKLLANKAISPTEYSQRIAELGKLLADKQ